MKLILNWAVRAGVIFFLAENVAGFYVYNWQAAFGVALVLGLLNVFVKPVIVLLTLPLNLLTLGLFSFAINALMVMLADWLLKNFWVQNFWYALLLSLALSAVNLLMHHLEKREE